MSGKHTPGPWTYWVHSDHMEHAGMPSSFGVAEYDGGEGFDIGQFCKVDHVELDPEEQAANARLIAAAPDLLAALRAIVPDAHEKDVVSVYVGKPIEDARALLARLEQ